VIDNQKIIIN
jgi:hypothetical protein